DDDFGQRVSAELDFNLWTVGIWRFRSCRCLVSRFDSSKCLGPEARTILCFSCSGIACLVGWNHEGNASVLKPVRRDFSSRSGGARPTVRSADPSQVASFARRHRTRGDVALWILLGRHSGRPVKASTTSDSGTYQSLSVPLSRYQPLSFA